MDELLTHHPAAVKWDADRDKHRSHLEPGLYRFLLASVWPDDIKRKKGMPNHGSWHYADLPITGPDSGPLPDPHPEHHVLAGLAENERVLQDSSASLEDRAVALSWVIHLVGDIHQPMHCATAVTAAHPDGDKGVNTDFFEPYASVGYTIGPVATKVGVNYAWSGQKGLVGKDDNTYVYGQAGVGIPGTPVTLTGHVGYTSGSLGLVNLDAHDRNYWDWSLNAEAVGGPLKMGVTYLDTDVTDAYVPALGGRFDRKLGRGSTVLGYVGFNF